jgi:hypothetical protein
MSRFILLMPVVALVTIFSYSVPQVKVSANVEVGMSPSAQAVVIHQESLRKARERNRRQASDRPKRTRYSSATRAF